MRPAVEVSVEAEEWDARYRSKELVWSAEPNRWVVEEVAGLTPGEALDLACGEGRNSLWLAERGWTVTGVDFSTVALARAARLADERGGQVASRVHWLASDVTAYEPLPTSFDLVLVSYLHLPAPERRRTLRRAAGALRRGGHLVVVAHDSTNLAAGSGGPSDPAVLYTAQDVLDDVLGTPRGAHPAVDGLEVVRAEAVRRPTESGTAVDALAHLRRA